MNLSEISWPVYRLAERKPLELDGVLFYSSESENKETKEAVIRLRIVDDKNIPKDTLGRRRMWLQAEHPSVKLFPLTKSVYLIQDLVKMAKSTTWFIDSNGRPFQYKKTTRAKLLPHKLKKVLPTGGLGSIVEVEGVPERFKVLFSPKPEHIWVGILHTGKERLLYGFYMDKFKPSSRNI